MSIEYFSSASTAEIITTILVNILITVALYSAFPLLFASLRKVPITKKKYRWICFGVNLIPEMIALIIAGKSSGGPYLLWTTVFAGVGVKNLASRGLLSSGASDTTQSTEAVAVQAPEETTLNNEDLSKAESLPQLSASSNLETNTFIKLAAMDAADYIDTNRSIPASESADPDYGLVPDKPIYTAFLDGQIEYLSSLRTLGGQTISWNRKGSTGVDGIHGLVDIYETYLPSGKPYKTLYLNMYSDKTSTTPPAGFSIIISGDDNSTEAFPATGSIHKQNDVDAALPAVCRKCGTKLPDDSMFCYKCGTKIEPRNNTQVNTPLVSTAGNTYNIATPNLQVQVNSSSTKSNLKTGLIFGAALLTLVLIAAYFSCFFGHEWLPSTCTEPKTCSRCGKTEGFALNHTWVAATCTEAKYCSVCGQKSGFPAGHKWFSGSADTPQTCIVCGKMQPLPLPETGTVFIGNGKYCYSELTIKSSSNSACYIKLKDANGSDAYSFFVRAGDTVAVPVPPGYYNVYFAYGNDWYGPDLLFGSETVCEKDDDLLDFKQYTWEYTLYPITNGNFSATPISLDEF